MQYPTKVTAAHFSPTRGTLKAVGLLAEKLGFPTEYIDLTIPSIREQEFVFGRNELLLAACPVYAGQIPRVLKLFQNLKGDQTPCVLVAAYGNRHYDDTLAQMQAILEKQGFICIAGMACIIPHVFSEILGAGRPDEEDRERFGFFAGEIRAKLSKKKLVNIPLPGNPHPTEKPSSPIAKLRDTSICILCMDCIHECPTQAINPETKEIDSLLCINCMHCCLVCKSNARSFDAAELQAYLEENYIERRSVECFF